MLDDSELKNYQQDGFVVLENVVGDAEVTRIRAECERLFATDHPGRVFEKDGTTVRGVHGCHLYSDLFARLIRVPALLGIAEQVLGGRVYVHQFKINAKRALAGDTWPWHQDFAFWRREDGMRAPRIVSVALFVEPVDENNGPMLFVPGSHRLGLIGTAGDAPTHPEGDDWTSNFGATLDLSLSAEQLTPLVEKSGIRSATGPAGSVLVFDPCIVHGSGVNMTPYDRSLVVISYNSVDNTLAPVARPRPDFLSARDREPLTALTDEL